MLHRFYYVSYFPHGITAPSGSGSPHIEASQSHSVRHTTRYTDLYLTIHNTHRTQETDIHAPAGFEPAFPASDCPQTHALGSTAIGIGK